MSIQIVDNFNVGTDKPIDNRFVVGPGQFYTNKDSIQNKYIGLRIWDMNSNSAYVWKGSIWEQESSGGEGTVGPGEEGFIAKFTSPEKIGNSIIREGGGQIQINGSLFANSLSGNGTSITQINASNITNGVLSVSRLQGTLNKIIVGQGLGSPSSWVNLNDVSVGNSSRITLTSSTASNVHYLTMGKNATTGQTIYTSNFLKYYPSNGKMTLSGSLSVGTESDAPDSGLLVGGSVRFPGLGQFSSGLNQPKFTVVSSGLDFDLKLDTGTTIPIGGIILWMEPEIPEGFVLCDGSTYQNDYLDQIIVTPNLMSKFVIGSSDGYLLGNYGDINTSSFGDVTHKYIGVNFIMYIGYGFQYYPNN